ncbi:hypothetical protein Vretimale_15874 [Volvox reticuliferus]|uniref:Uncharacterized protein n=1 Tax=Volvox reticuliferus TaxID=1737510 RepID=A0A8J4CLW6_9CHLO|nr:hypothetical protein Vretifemale_12937 [Volvox reticuliferus]GIM12557.1 hypothetical protein Vretimale_15874 [Volvox reticuliferus]
MRETKRRKMGYWEPFNVWWREYVAQHDKRPKVHEMKKWYEANAERVWGGTGPTWDETKKHSKGMRRIEDISDYFRQYRRGRRKKAAGCSMDSDTSDSDADEIAERASTPDSEKHPRSQAKATRKGQAGGAGARGRGRPKQETTDFAGSVPSSDRPSISGSSAQVPHHSLSQQQPPSSTLALPQVADGHAPMAVGMPSLPVEDEENLLHKQELLQMHHHQHQHHQQNQPQQLLQEQQPFPQLVSSAHCGGAEGPYPSALPPVHQHRLSSSSMHLGVHQLRSASTMQLPPAPQLRTPSATVLPSDPAPPPPPPLLLRPPQQQSQMVMGLAPATRGVGSYPSQSHEQHLHHHQHAQLDEPEQMHQHQQQHPDPLHSHYNPYRQDLLPQEEYGDAASPPEPHIAQPHYPKIFGMPVPGLPFFGGWRSRSGTIPPNPPPGHPHQPPYAAHPVAAPPPHIQRAMTMPRTWSQPTAPAPPPAPRRLGSWGMMRMLSMPRTVSPAAVPPPPVGQQMQPAAGQQQQQQRQQRLPPAQPQPAAPRSMTSHTPFAMRAGTAIINGIVPFLRGSASPPPQSSSVPSQVEPYLDNSAVLPPDSYMTSTSPPAAAATVMAPCYSPPHLYANTSPPQPYVNSSPPQPYIQTSPPQQQPLDQSMSPPDQSLAQQPLLRNGLYMNGQLPPSQLPPADPSYMAVAPQANGPLHNSHVVQPPKLQTAQPQLPSQLALQPATPPPVAAPASVPASVLAPPPPPPPQALAALPLQPQELVPCPLPDPFRTPERVVSLTHVFEFPTEPVFQNQIRMGGADGGRAALQDAQAIVPDGYLPDVNLTHGSNPAAAVVAASIPPDVPMILENADMGSQVVLDGNSPAAVTQVSTDQRTGSGSGSLIGRLFTRGSTMQRLRELFWSWANTESDVLGQDATVTPRSADGGASRSGAGVGEAAGVALPPPSPVPMASPAAFWVRSNSNPRGSVGGSPRPGPSSPDYGPNPFRQQLQRLGSMSSSWLLGKRSREDSSPTTQTSTPTSRKLQRGISGVFRPLVDMMSFGRRSSNLGISNSVVVTADAAATALAVEPTQPPPPQDLMLTDHASIAAAEHGAVAMVQTPPVVVAEISTTAAAVAAPPELGQVMSTDADGDRLLLEALDSRILAALDEETQAAVVPEPLPLPPPEDGDENADAGGGALIQGLDDVAMRAPPPPVQPQLHQPAIAQIPVPMDITPPAAVALAPAAVLTPAPGAQVIGSSNTVLPFLAPRVMPHQPPPPNSANGSIGPPVITTGARPTAAAVRPQPTPQQLPFGSYSHGPQSQIVQQQLQLPQEGPMVATAPGATSSLWQHQQHPQDYLPLGCSDLQTSHHQLPPHAQQTQMLPHHPNSQGHVPNTQDDVNGNGGMLLRLSNSVTELLKQVVWGNHPGR